MKKPKLNAVQGFQLSEAQRQASAIRQAVSGQKLSPAGVLVLADCELVLNLLDSIRFNCDIKPV